MDINLLNDSLNRAVRLSDKQKKTLVNWFKNQNILIQIDIFREQKNQFFKLKSTTKAEEILPLAAFYLAIHKYYQEDNIAKIKNKTKSLNSVAGSDFFIKKARKTRVKDKKERLLNLWSVVLKMKDENFSFRQISDYLKTRHRLTVSHTYIRQVWMEIEND